MKSLSTLVKIIQTLRGKNGCPWDRKQTPQTMWKCLAEEMYELLAAIEADEPDEVCDELGDVLFQLVFIAEIYRERGKFDIQKSIARSAAKMIRRHPHVYGAISVNSEEELWTTWENIKKEEKQEAEIKKAAQLKSGKKGDQLELEVKEKENQDMCMKKTASVLDSVPAGMPALMRSYKISERAVRAGFDWKDIYEVIQKASEEWNEFIHALSVGDKSDIEMEFGDVLFTLGNVARLAGIHPEIALNSSTCKFEKRFRYMEQILAERGVFLKDVPRQELESLWDKAKEMVF
ncbi:MAG: nucleoside triphosphate pyrophosphohydrolase [Desulfamplus sp.]|nr:nucleoside triphosphate pyrophosphohydrolase [Desulfamplus sp.]